MKGGAKIIIAYFLIFSLGFGTFAIPFTTQAQGYQGTFGQGGNTLQGVGGVLAGCAKTIGTFFAGVIASEAKGFISSAISSSVPTADKNVAKANMREECVNAIAYYAAKKMLAKISISTINWINGGFEGKPLYLENPGSFFQGIIDEEVSGITDAIGFDPLRFPNGRVLAEHLLDSVSRSFEENAAYSLGQIVQNDQGFISTDPTAKTKFSNGGWNGFLAATLEPQNNPVGFFFMVAQKIDSNAGGKTEARREELRQGEGFLSVQKCVEPNNYPKNLSKKEIESQKRDIQRQLDKLTDDLAAYDRYKKTGIGGGIGRDFKDPNFGPTTQSKIAALRTQLNGFICTRYEVQTPGKAIASSLDITLGTSTRQLELADDINESLAGIFDALFSQLAQQGLASLSKGYTKEGKFFAGFSQENLNERFGSTLSNWDFNEDIDLAEILIGPLEGDDAYGPFNGQRNESKSYIAVQKGYVEALKETNMKLQELITSLEYLDYAVPGPHPGWQEDAETNLQVLANKTSERINQKSIVWGQPLDIPSGLNTKGGVDVEYSLSLLQYYLPLFQEGIERYAQQTAANFSRLVDIVPVAPEAISQTSRLDVYREQLDQNVFQIEHTQQLISQLKYMCSQVAILIEYDDKADGKQICKD